jgi:hypothetical protein
VNNPALRRDNEIHQGQAGRGVSLDVDAPARQWGDFAGREGNNLRIAARH